MPPAGPSHGRKRRRLSDGSEKGVVMVDLREHLRERPQSPGPDSWVYIRQPGSVTDMWGVCDLGHGLCGPPSVGSRIADSG